MSLRQLRILGYALLFAPAIAFAQTLPLPANLVGASTDAGEALLVGAEAREAYFSLADNFVTQKTQSFCGVASMTMVFNAMAIPAPAVPEYVPYNTFTQDNVLDDKTEVVIPKATILKMGMTLDQLGAAIATKPVEATVRHAADTSLDTFRTEARDYLAKDGHFVIVNYLRKAMGQQTGGHISPLAAYDEDTDRFLILDVARYKYPPVWVTSADLYAAMNTPDSDNGNRSRGYVLIAKKVGP
ncbi:glutathione gamma-glutamylcysteinyltransferase [Kaistia algarum]|uniref:phytochelatin synthase family protein n=1 Tax=Kaistia algarum TaxID=2083279 RepID=UPI000CE879F1|nr:phytochelatin synthase family protein [Kaistia algarum]MCX5515662.1 phytochelatin synthase family protein [Kaistia algarum]PPE80954.1 glutathione gamma-glutamylcysteinyltransferase [Kaistia algarum]